jgi:hypothetical protein
MSDTGAGFYELAPWLRAWFHPDRKAAAALAGPAQEAAFDHLAEGWGKIELGELLRAGERRFGKATLLEVIDRVVAENIRPEWAALAAREGKSGVADLARLLLEPLRTAPGWSLSMTDERGGLQLHCTRCPFATFGREQDLSEWMLHLVCGGDPHIVAGFNPKMGFRRTRLLTAGDDHCDHFYFMQEA